MKKPIYGNSATMDFAIKNLLLFLAILSPKTKF